MSSKSILFFLFFLLHRYFFFFFFVIPALFRFSSLWLCVPPSFSAWVCQTWNAELLFRIEAWELYLKYVNFRNQILFTDRVQADSRDSGPKNCGSWIIYKLLMCFALWLYKPPSVFRHLWNDLSLLKKTHTKSSYWILYQFSHYIVG